MATIFERRKRAEKFYAFNIDQKKSENDSHRNVNFEKINQGFYDELLVFHDKIKSDISKLEKSKSNSFKESVYTNIKIPDTWTTKENYYSELYKTMDKDKFFVSYLGKGNELENENIYNNNNKNSILKKSYDFKNKYKLEKIEDFQDKNFLIKAFRKINSKNESKKKSNPLLAFINKNKEKGEVNYILEEYEKKYPILLPSIIVRKEPTLIHGLNDFLLEEEKFIKKEKKEEENENDILHHHNNFITGNLENKNSNKNNNNENIEISKSNTKELQETKNSISNESLKSEKTNKKKKNSEQEKKEVFKTTLFNNMLPLKDNIMYRNKPYQIKTENSFESPFLNSTTAKFNEKVIITNPKINERLNSIKFWGPYFSHCPPCRNKSLNFYQTMETNQCLTLLDYLRKVRNSQNIVK